MADDFVRGLARLALRIFFRDVETHGMERIPERGPAIVVANHVNSLMDAVLIVGTLPRMPRFLAKSTLWQITLLRPFLKLGGVIPVYRRQDPGVDTSKNQETFARCHEELRNGGIIAMFPEGISHNKPNLQPLKTGAARIALEADDKFGPLDIQVLPCGLEWETKGRFRSLALVQLGSPVALASPDTEAPGDDPRQAAYDLTARIEEGLRGVTVNYESWQEARLLARAADLYGRAEAPAPGGSELVERTSLRRAFLEGYRSLSKKQPEAVRRVERAVDEYDSLLEASGLRDDQVSASYPLSTIFTYLLKTLFQLTFRLPLAAIGTTLNWPPFRLTGWIAERFSPSADTDSTYKLFPGVLLFPLFWLAAAGAAGAAAGIAASGRAGIGWWWALGVLVLAPVSGWVAMRFHDRRRSFFTETRAYLKLFGSRSLSRDLREKRSLVRQEVGRLVELYQSSHPKPQN